ELSLDATVRRAPATPDLLGPSMLKSAVPTWKSSASSATAGRFATAAPWATPSRDGSPQQLQCARMSTRAPEASLWDALRGALVTRALAIVADLGVPEAVADGPMPVQELAGELGADTDALHRLLRALASDGIFVETEPGVFGNTPTSEALLDPGWKASAHLFG